jgi:hypothetical protein
MAQGGPRQKLHLPSCLLLRTILITALPVRFGILISEFSSVRKMFAKAAQVGEVEWLATKSSTWLACNYIVLATGLEKI